MFKVLTKIVKIKKLLILSKNVDLAAVVPIFKVKVC